MTDHYTVKLERVTRARTLVIYADLLPMLWQLYAPQVAREQAWRQQAARGRWTRRALVYHRRQLSA